MMLTTQFFAMKIQRYLHEHDIDPAVLADDRRQGLPQRRAEPERVASHADVGGGDRRRRRWSARPADEVHVLLAGRGRGRAGAVPGRHRPPLHRRRRSCCARASCAPATTARSRCSARRWRPSAPMARPSHAARAAFEQAGIGPERRRRRPDPGHRVGRRADAHGRDRPVRARRAGGADPHRRRPRSTGRLPINTDGGCLANGEPIGASGLRQVHENVLQLRGAAGDRQVPGEPKVAFTHVYGAPGVSACTVLST